MTREDLKRIIERITDEQLKSILYINTADIGKAKKDYETIKSENDTLKTDELALVIVMNAPFGEYGKIFDSDGNVTLAHNGDYKPILLEEVKN